jgi:hypothetical protein
MKKKKSRNEKVAKLLLGTGSWNLKKLLKEMGRGNKVYKTFNDTEVSVRK